MLACQQACQIECHCARTSRLGRTHILRRRRKSHRNMQGSTAGHSERGKLTICKQVAHHELLTPKQWKHNYSCTHMHTHTQTQILNNSRLQRLGRSETKIKFPWHLGPEADGDRTWQQKHFGTRVIYGQSLLLLYSRQF